MTAPSRLTPLSPLGILDTATRLYRRNLRAYLRELRSLILTIGLAFLVIGSSSGMLLLGQWYWPFGLTHVAQLIYASGGALLPADLRTVTQELAAFWVLQAFGTALLLRPVVNSYIGPVAWAGEPGPDTTARLALALLALLPLALLGSTVAVALTLVSVWLDILGAPGGLDTLGALARNTFLPLLALAAAVAALARLAVAPQIVLLERLPLRAALRRSWRLTRGAYLRVLATLLLLALLSGLLVGLPLLLSSMARWLADDSLADWLPWLGLLLSQVLQTLLLPLPVVALTVLYIDLRVRAEGFDLAVAASRAEQAPAALPAGHLRLWWDRYWDRYRANDADGALRVLDEALQHFPREHNLLRQRIAVRVWRNDLLGALADAERLVAAYPTYLDALVDRAGVRRRLGDEHGALIDLERVLAQQPDHTAALHLRSHLRYLRADYAGSRADLLRVLQTAPDDHAALYNTACCYAREGQLELALDYLARAVAAEEVWRTQAADDEDFAPLRADPRFVALIGPARSGEESSPYEPPQ